jgi:hypothetical protein
MHCAQGVIKGSHKNKEMAMRKPTRNRRPIHNNSCSRYHAFSFFADEIDRKTKNKDHAPALLLFVYPLLSFFFTPSMDATDNKFTFFISFSVSLVAFSLPLDV